MRRLSSRGRCNIESRTKERRSRKRETVKRLSEDKGTLARQKGWSNNQSTPVPVKTEHVKTLESREDGKSIVRCGTSYP